METSKVQAFPGPSGADAGFLVLSVALDHIASALKGAERTGPRMLWASCHSDGHSYGQGSCRDWEMHGQVPAPGCPMFKDYTACIRVMVD